MTESFTKQIIMKKRGIVRVSEKRNMVVDGAKENKGIIKDKVSENLVNVFVPTTPNPTSGFLLMLPKDLIYLEAL